MKFIIIAAYSKQYRQPTTMLIEKDEFEEDPEPSNYFPPHMIDAEIKGEVQMVGDADELDTIYKSDS